jgi:serine/threonine protein kinase/Tol biopolymer transport system component
MSLSSGFRLGSYEIVAAIGTGGMGEVFRARDTKLNRDVAIKVLTAAFADDPERLARFTREAQTLASLNHPNIAAIYGIEDVPAVVGSGSGPGSGLGSGSHSRALVMELVEGEDLTAHMSRGPIPITEALPILRQIAEALEEAHEHGIVHRDLKPGNIKVTPDAKVKVLDFGLAKAMDQGSGSASNQNISDSPTMSRQATEAGVILGTVAYMSPEQARGKPVDRRADIWSFGVVAYEMLTGSRLFTGETVSDTLAAVLRAEPDWGMLPAGTPAGLRRLLIRCLKKDPKARLRDIGEARQQIEELTRAALEETAGATDKPAVLLTALPTSATSPALTWALAATTIGLLIMSGGWWSQRRAGSAATHAAFKLTPLSFEKGGQGGAAWSPDGKAVAIRTRQKDTDPHQLFVRYLDSPAPTQVTTLPDGVGGISAWTTTGRIVFVRPSSPQLWSVSPVGGEPELFGSQEQPAGPKLEPIAAPRVTQDGIAVAGVFRAEDGVVSVWTWSQSDTRPKPYEPAPFATRTIFSGTSLRFSPDGRQILLVRDAGGNGQEAWLMPYPADPAHPPHQIFEGLAESRQPPTFSWMPDNRHVVLSASTAGGKPQLYMGDTVTSAVTLFSTGTRAQTSPAVSPDGKRLAFVESDNDFDVVSVDLTTARVTEEIATLRAEEQPSWASQRARMAYITDRNGFQEVWLHEPGQTDRPLVTPRDFPPGATNGFANPDLSPDGARVIYRFITTGRPGGLWISAVAGGAPVRLVKGSNARESGGSWSPDGNWYVYVSYEDGRLFLKKVKTTGEAAPVLLRELPAIVTLVQDVARVGGWGPQWSPANDWILYRHGGLKLISPDGATTRDVSGENALVYTFSADGRTIYGLRQSTPADPLELFSKSATGGPEKTIGSLPREYAPQASSNPALRLTLAPGGKSLTYSIAKATANLWLMDGIDAVKVR